MVFVAAEYDNISGRGFIFRAVYAKLYMTALDKDDLMAIVEMGLLFQQTVGKICFLDQVAHSPPSFWNSIQQRNEICKIYIKTNRIFIACGPTPLYNEEKKE